MVGSTMTAPHAEAAASASVRRRPAGVRSAAAASLVLAVAGLVAGVADPSRAGTLDTIKAKGSIALGYRTDAAPFSSVDATGTPVGYSIDLCMRVVAAAKQATGLANLAVVHVPVTAENRFDKLEAGEIDIECGSTTRTLSRQERVNFTLLTFVTGAELLVRVGSNVNRLADLEGKNVAILPGTTTDAAVRAQLAQQLVNATVVPVGDHEDGLAAVNDGRADAYASDEVILIGLVKTAKNVTNLRLTGSLYTYEPYALPVRKNDAEFRLVADRALAQTYRSAQAIGGLYERWFGKWAPRPNPFLLALYRIQELPD